MYEAIAEGGITRFAAIYQATEPAEVGPVRSVRPQDPDLAAPLHGIAGFSGGVAPIVADLATVAQNLSADTAAGAPAYHRSTDRSAPHNLYASPRLLWAAAKSPYEQAPAPLFSYGALSPAASGATKVTVPMSGVANVVWTWSEGAWRRSQDGVPFTVAGSGRIGPANVIIQSVHIASAGYQDVAGTPVPSSVVIGSGRAMLLRDGKSLSGSWSKPTRDAVTIFTADDGERMLLHPGRTWVELLPDTATATLGR